MATLSGYNITTGEVIILGGVDATGVEIPTAHSTLSGRDTSGSHPISAITNLSESLDDKISKTDVETQSISSNIEIDGDLTVMSDTIFATASPISETTLSYSEADDKALLTKEQIADAIDTILPTYPTTDGTYKLELSVVNGIGTLHWV